MQVQQSLSDGAHVTPTSANELFVACAFTIAKLQCGRLCQRDGVLCDPRKTAVQYSHGNRLVLLLLQASSQQVEGGDDRCLVAKSDNEAVDISLLGEGSLHCDQNF